MSSEIVKYVKSEIQLLPKSRRAAALKRLKEAGYGTKGTKVQTAGPQSIRSTINQILYGTSKSGRNVPQSALKIGKEGVKNFRQDLSILKQKGGTGLQKGHSALKVGGDKLSKLGLKLGPAGKYGGRILTGYAAWEQGKKVFNPKDNIALTLANAFRSDEDQLGESRLAQLRRQRAAKKKEEQLNQSRNFAELGERYQKLQDELNYQESKLSITPQVKGDPEADGNPRLTPVQLAKETKAPAAPDRVFSDVHTIDPNTGKALGVMTRAQRRAWEANNQDYLRKQANMNAPREYFNRSRLSLSAYG